MCAAIGTASTFSTTVLLVVPVRPVRVVIATSTIAACTTSSCYVYNKLTAPYPKLNSSGSETDLASAPKLRPEATLENPETRNFRLTKPSSVRTLRPQRPAFVPGFCLRNETQPLHYHTAAL